MTLLVILTCCIQVLVFIKARWNTRLTLNSMSTAEIHPPAGGDRGEPRWSATNQIKIKSNHFYCHITTAQVPWWVKFLWACSRQCRKTTDNLPMDRQCKKKKKKFTYGQTVQKTALEHLQCSRQCRKTTDNLPMDRQCKKTTDNLHMDRQCKKLHWSIYSAPDSAKNTTTAIYIWTDSAKNCTGAFTVLQTVQKKKKNNSNLHMDSTYLQTVQKTMCKIHIHILSTHSVL